MSAGLQLSTDVGGHTVLDLHPCVLPDAEPGRLDRRLHIGTELDNVQQHLHGRLQDTVAARRGDREPEVVSVDHVYRGHATAPPLAGFDPVRSRTLGIGLAPVDEVVQQHTRLGDHHSRSEAVAQRLGDAGDVAVRIDGSQVGGQSVDLARGQEISFAEPTPAFPLDR